LITIAQALQHSLTALVEVSDTPNLDAQILLAHCFDKSRAWILTHPEANLTESIYSALLKNIELLEKGTPLPYVLGDWEFYGLDFTLTPDTLIPRPETELLVEQAINWLDLHPEHQLAVDLGTGSGCIAISITKVNPDLTVIATDISYPALKVARKNSVRHKVSDRVFFLQTDLFPPIARQFDLIIANMPYIPTQTLDTLKVSKGEPKLALDGGAKGLDLISRVLKESPAHLKPGGIVLIEIESSQGSEALSISRGAFPSAEINLLQDLSGFDRLITIFLPEYL
jgi:release factor glutamine methyltransferase